MASAVARCLTGERYFAFIHLLFENQPAWIRDFDRDGQITKQDILEGLAQMGAQVGMDRQKVEACADDQKNLAIVDANWQEGRNKYGVDSTPTFVINGTVHVGEMSYEQIRDLLDSLLSKS